MELTQDQQAVMKDLGIEKYERYFFADVDLVMYDVPVYHTSRTIIYRDFSKDNLIKQIREVIREFNSQACESCPADKPIIGISDDGIMFCENCRSDFEQCAECGQLFYRDNIKYDEEDVPYCKEHIGCGVYTPEKGETKADWGY
jgi:hypothetical protein